MLKNHSRRGFLLLIWHTGCWCSTARPQELARQDLVRQSWLPVAIAPWHMRIHHLPRLLRDKAQQVLDGCLAGASKPHSILILCCRFLVTFVFGTWCPSSSLSFLRLGLVSGGYLLQICPPQSDLETSGQVTWGATSARPSKSIDCW